MVNIFKLTFYGTYLLESGLGRAVLALLAHQPRLHGAALAVPGGRLSVNVDASHGALHVEALEPDGNVVTRSVAVTGDQPNTNVRWEEGDISEWTGRQLSLRFTLREARLYSYWLE